MRESRSSIKNTKINPASAHHDLVGFSSQPEDKCINAGDGKDKGFSQKCSSSKDVVKSQLDKLTVVSQTTGTHTHSLTV